MNYANEIYRIRQKICENIKAPMSLRDMLSSSKILQILQKSGFRIEIGHLKAVLKELGFNWNGPACSIT
jgi:transposase